MNSFSIGRDDTTGEISFESHGKHKVVLFFKCKSFEYSTCGSDKNGHLHLIVGTVKNTDQGLSDLLDIIK